MRKYSIGAKVFMFILIAGMIGSVYSMWLLL